MAQIIINGELITCRDDIPNVLQAALEAGLDIPHYCYHPSLSIVASCRLCLMEQKMPHPQTRQLGWAPRLIPSCQTPVRNNPDGSPMEVRFDSESVKSNQRHVMEYLLINHPLDCPVCDQAGECYLQDYSLKFGNASSRMVDQKHKNPKKDIGPQTLLYADRCVMCSRCVRFTREVTGTAELAVINRGHRAEIDVFPGQPLDNPLQGNVVDICPVGCLLDKDFLFKQRVWLLSSTPGITIADASGANIRIDHNDGTVHRIKPRYNPAINGFWISDEQRYSYKHIHAPTRLALYSARTPNAPAQTQRTPCGVDQLVDLLRKTLTDTVQLHGTGSCYLQLSPFMTNEEAFLLAGTVRAIDPKAVLGLGFVPVEGHDQLFPVGTTDPAKAKFTIYAEKCPNRRGIEAILNHFGGTRIDHGPQPAPAEALTQAIANETLRLLWIVGGHPHPLAPWRSETAALLSGQTSAPLPEHTLIVQDLFASPLADLADILIASGSFAEREGSFTNIHGQTQHFERAIPPVADFVQDGEWISQLAGRFSLYDPTSIREEVINAGINLHIIEAPAEVEHQH